MASGKHYTRAAQDFMSGLPGSTGFNSGFRSLMEMQRKNIEAFTEAQHLAFENLQAVAQRHTELMTGLMREHADLTREIMSEHTPEQKIARQADLMKKNYENSVATLRELSEMLHQSGRQASDVINKRVSASLNEIKTALEKSAKQTQPAPARQKAAA